MSRNGTSAAGHWGGTRPFGYRLGEGIGRGRTHKLIEDPAEQQAIAMMRTMRQAGRSLMDIRDALRAEGFKISHQGVANILCRAASVTAGDAA